jgi:branched-subunit amino acid transport protein
MSLWLAIAGVGLLTFLTRASFILFADPEKFPPAFRVALLFVPPAVLAAITLPGLALVQGAIDFTLSNPRWIAGVVAVAVAMRTRSALATIAGGMAALWATQWIVQRTVG